MRDFAAFIKERQASGLYRNRRLLDSPQGVEVVVDGRKRVNFCSNDYLGLARHPRLVEALKDGADEQGVGSGASHLVCGHHRAHHRLEEALARLTGREAALLFSTGYMANLGTISALAGRGDTILEDRLNHASLIDGALLSRARLQRYRHGDWQHLEQLLARAEGQSLVVTDGVFSMDGDQAPLERLADACDSHQALLMVDDAHGLGVLGPGGAGTIAHQGLPAGRVPVLMGTLGKALGSAGAFVAGSRELIDFLVQQARTYIYTTAMPPALAEATLAAIGLLESEGWRRDQLQARIRQFRTGAEQLGYRLMASESPIQPLLVGDTDAALALSRGLEERGFWVTAIRPPTVPRGTARLRVTLSADHTERQVADLLAALGELATQEGETNG